MILKNQFKKLTVIKTLFISMNFIKTKANIKKKRKRLVTFTLIMLFVCEISSINVYMTMSLIKIHLFTSYEAIKMTNVFNLIYEGSRQEKQVILQTWPFNRQS